MGHYLKMCVFVNFKKILSANRIEEINAEMKASRNISEEMLEYLKEVKERDERQKRLLLEMKDDFARENYVIHLYQRVGKNGIEE